MKKIIKKQGIYLLCIILVGVIVYCGNKLQQNINQARKNSNKERYKSNFVKKINIETIKVRNCEYVLWHNGYGSDMEHYEGCENPKHYNAVFTNKTKKNNELKTK